MNMLKRSAIFILAMLAAPFTGAQNQPMSVGALNLEIDPATGGIQSIINRTDATSMNWIMRSDGSQYAWQVPEMAWGLGFCKVNGIALQWTKPAGGAGQGGQQAYTYEIGAVQLTVKRSRGEGGGMTESYVFSNPTEQPVKLTDIGIYTPFNDNYPDPKTCIEKRCNAHIWAGNSSSYVFAQRMGSTPPHLGLVLTEGSLQSYEILNRGPGKGTLNERGTIALNPEDIVIEPGSSYTLTWEVFPCTSRNDFFMKARTLGLVEAKAVDFTVEKDEEIRVRFSSLKELPDVQCYLNDEEVEFTQSRNNIEVRVVPETAGEQVITLRYDGNKSTFARFYRIEDIDALIQKRYEFILTKQLMRSATDPRVGAFMVYDNETDAIYQNKDGRKSLDTNEARERLGMGVLVARYLRSHPNAAVQKILEQYHAFVRTKLQTKDYVTHTGVNDITERGYDYPWVAQFHLEMYKLTRNPDYLEDYYQTMRRFFERFNHDFYAIGIPVSEGLDLLDRARMKDEHDLLLEDCRKMADRFVANSTAFPKSEMNYGQGIVGPSVVFLLEMYDVTHEKSYLDEASRQMVLLETFSGMQPDYHLYDIAIRHWDGYRFGKRRVLGDTMPQYGSTITAEAYLRFGKVSGSGGYIERAKSIIRSNLCLFSDDGSASTAYIYPARVNGQKAAFFDPFANDQDWALVYYLENASAVEEPATGRAPSSARPSRR